MQPDSRRGPNEIPIDAIRVIVSPKELGGAVEHVPARRESNLLLAEELAFVAMDPTALHGSRATASRLSPYLAGLLLGELMLEGVVAGGQANTIEFTGRPAPVGTTLASVANIVANNGPKVKAILSHMDRALREEVGLGTWRVSALGLVEAGLVAPLNGGRGFHYKLLSPTTRDAVVDRLRASATNKKALDPRVALLLSMASLAGLLATVVPERGERSHARRRIDRALDGSELKPVERVTRRVAAEGLAAVPLSSLAS